MKLGQAIKIINNNESRKALFLCTKLDSLGDKEFQAQKAIVAEEYKITHDIAKSLKNVANKMNSN